jgi:alpha-mannosidase/mannosylglycerate hydrolase
MKKRTVKLVVSTHWDREWRESFQDLRYEMVRLIDQAVEALESGQLKGPFHTDGQSIVLEDYLEIRPGLKERVEKLVKAGRFEVGPWFTMPDEFTVSGESLVRNLVYGRERARAIGARPSSAGYMPDMFGHNSQMPQIFAGCGIKAAFIWRGIDNSEKRNFIWRGADGTEMPTHKFGMIGYCTWPCQVGRRNEYDRNVEDDPARFRTLMEKFLQTEAAATEADSILLLEGGDHQTWNQRQLDMLFEALRDHPQFKVAHTSLEDHLRDIVAARDRIAGVLEGELRTPGRPYPGPGADLYDACGQWVIPGVLSSRVRLKQANSQCQALLCQWAEPFGAFAHAAIGSEYPRDFLDFAWRWLLKNHAHDSIDCCSIDQVHRDMAYRFDQSRLVADRLATEATSRIAASVEGVVSDREMRVTVFNPLPRDVSRVFEVNLEIPTNWPCFNEFFGFEPKPGFRIHAPDGTEIPYQRLGQAMNRVRQRVREKKWPEIVTFHHVSVALPLDVPACGYATFLVRGTEAVVNTRHPGTPGLATSERSMANEFLDVRIESNGTLTVTDRRTGRVYPRQLTFEERADIGDGWYHGVACNDQVFASSACRADMALVQDGPMLTRFRIRTVMQVPEAFRFDSMTRSDRFVDLVVDSTISLRPGQGHLEIETRVDNAVDDHRLRVLFPSGARTDTYLADTPFDVVERPIALRKDNHEFRELEVETKPQQSWTAVHDAESGLAVVADGLLETAVRDIPDRTLALTLFRGTRRTVLTNGEPEGQMRGPLAFRYCLVPLAGAPDRVGLSELGQQLAAGFRAVQLRKEDIEMFRSGTVLKPAGGCLKLEGPAVMTSARRAGKGASAGLEVRMFNPAAEAATVRLHAGPLAGDGKRGGEVERVDMEGRLLEKLGRLANGSIELSLRPKQILTVKIR